MEQVIGNTQWRTTHSGTQGDFLCEFSDKIVNLLVEETIRVLNDQYQNEGLANGGIELALYLLQDAMKYDLLYHKARGGAKEITEAAKKLRQANAMKYPYNDDGTIWIDK